MSDNVTADPGSGGAVFATDDVGGVHYPIGKLAYGALDSVTVVSTSNGLPVQIIGTPSVVVTNAGTFACQATQAGTWTVTGTGGTFPVTDSGGSLTVDAPVGTPVFVRFSDGSAAITTLPVSLASVPSHAVTNAGTFVVQVDGAALTSLQLADDVVYAEDAAHSSGDKGTFILAVRRDANTTFVSTDGDYSPLSVDSSGSLKVAIISGAGSGGTAMSDDAAFTIASTSFTPIGGTYKSTLDSVDDGDGGAVHMTIKRALHVNLRDASGNEVSVGGGTQYNEADTDASITGTAILWEDTSDTLRAVSAAKPLPVTVADAAASTITTGSFGATTTATAIAASISAPRGVVVKVDDAATAAVWFGGSTITSNGTDATDGVKLSPGDTWYFNVANVSTIYAKSASGTQEIQWSLA